MNELAAAARAELERRELARAARAELERRANQPKPWVSERYGDIDNFVEERNLSGPKEWLARGHHAAEKFGRYPAAFVQGRSINLLDDILDALDYGVNKAGLNEYVTGDKDKPMDLGGQVRDNTNQLWESGDRVGQAATIGGLLYGGVKNAHQLANIVPATARLGAVPYGAAAGATGGAVYDLATAEGDIGERVDQYLNRETLTGLPAPAEDAALGAGIGAVAKAAPSVAAAVGRVTGPLTDAGSKQRANELLLADLGAKGVTPDDLAANQGRGGGEYRLADELTERAGSAGRLGGEGAEQLRSSMRAREERRAGRMLDTFSEAATRPDVDRIRVAIDEVDQKIAAATDEKVLSQLQRDRLQLQDELAQYTDLKGDDVIPATRAYGQSLVDRRAKLSSERGYGQMGGARVSDAPMKPSELDPNERIADADIPTYAERSQQLARQGDEMRLTGAARRQEIAATGRAFPDADEPQRLREIPDDALLMRHPRSGGFKLDGEGGLRDLLAERAQHRGSPADGRWGRERVVEELRKIRAEDQARGGPPVLNNPGAPVGRLRSLKTAANDMAEESKRAGRGGDERAFRSFAERVRVVLADGVRGMGSEGPGTGRRVSMIGDEYYSKLTRAIEAFEKSSGVKVKTGQSAGPGFFRSNPEDLAKFVDDLEEFRGRLERDTRLSDEVRGNLLREMDRAFSGYRVGAVRSYLDFLQQNPVSKGARVFNDDNMQMRARLRTLFRSEDEMEAFLRSVDDEGVMQRTEREVLYGSQTASRTAADLDTTDAAGGYKFRLGEMLSRGVDHLVLDLLARQSNNIAERFGQGITRRVADHLARQLDRADFEALAVELKAAQRQGRPPSSGNLPYGLRATMRQAAAKAERQERLRVRMASRGTPDQRIEQARQDMERALAAIKKADKELALEDLTPKRRSVALRRRIAALEAIQNSNLNEAEALAAKLGRAPTGEDLSAALERTRQLEDELRLANTKKKEAQWGRGGYKNLVVPGLKKKIGDLEDRLRKAEALNKYHQKKLDKGGHSAEEVAELRTQIGLYQKRVSDLQDEIAELRRSPEPQQSPEAVETPQPREPADLPPFGPEARVRGVKGIEADLDGLEERYRQIYRSTQEGNLAAYDRANTPPTRGERFRDWMAPKPKTKKSVFEPARPKETLEARRKREGEAAISGNLINRGDSFAALYEDMQGLYREASQMPGAEEAMKRLEDMGRAMRLLDRNTPTPAAGSGPRRSYTDMPRDEVKKLSFKVGKGATVDDKIASRLVRSRLGDEIGFKGQPKRVFGIGVAGMDSTGDAVRILYQRGVATVEDIDEEVMHALMALDAFKPNELVVLRHEARKGGWVQKYVGEDLEFYKGFYAEQGLTAKEVDDLVLEEAIAKRFASGDFLNGSTAEKNIAERMVAFIKALIRLVLNQPNADEILRAADRGDYASSLAR